MKSRKTKNHVLNIHNIAHERGYPQKSESNKENERKRDEERASKIGTAKEMHLVNKIKSSIARFKLIFILCAT